MCTQIEQTTNKQQKSILNYFTGLLEDLVSQAELWLLFGLFENSMRETSHCAVQDEFKTISILLNDEEYSQLCYF